MNEMTPKSNTAKPNCPQCKGTGMVESTTAYTTCDCTFPRYIASITIDHTQEIVGAIDITTEAERRVRGK